MFEPIGDKSCKNTMRCPNMAIARSQLFSEVHEKLSQTMDEIKLNFDNAKKRINAMEKMSKVSGYRILVTAFQRC